MKKSYIYLKLAFYKEIIVGDLLLFRNKITAKQDLLLRDRYKNKIIKRIFYLLYFSNKI